MLNWRIWAAISLCVILAGTHWKAYRVGENTIQAQWNADKLQHEQATLKVSEAYRQKEQALQLSVERVKRDYSKEKQAHAATAAAHADSLRRLEGILDGIATTNPATAAGVDDDPRLRIIAECAGTLVQMDAVVRVLAAQTGGLQKYASSVCVNGKD